MVYIVVLAGSSFLVVGELNGLALVVLTLIKPKTGDGHHKQQKTSSHQPAVLHTRHSLRFLRVGSTIPPYILHE